MTQLFLFTEFTDRDFVDIIHVLEYTQRALFADVDGPKDGCYCLDKQMVEEACFQIGAQLKRLYQIQHAKESLT